MTIDWEGDFKFHWGLVN